MPTYLAGRDEEISEFQGLLRQETVFKNLVLTGLRGVGKTVLLDTLKPDAIRSGWLWVGADLSETASLSEERLALRLLTDLTVVTATIVAGTRQRRRIGTHATGNMPQPLGFPALAGVLNETPGLVSDKIKAVLELVWARLAKQRTRGVVFAYDEAQSMSDHPAREQYPLSMLLDVFYSLQKKGVPFMLVLAGLPTLFPNLVEARTFAERMFHVARLESLNDANTRDAIIKPLAKSRSKVRFGEPEIKAIVTASGGYPYFIQFICREAFDAHLQGGGARKAVSIEGILRKLDSDFFFGRWSRTTDRQRELLWVIANLPHCDSGFTVQQTIARSRRLLKKPFSTSHVSQMLATLGQVGLVYRNRHGHYSFAIPMLGQFILRQGQSGLLTP